MIAVKPSANIIGAIGMLKGPYASYDALVHIEKCGRVCYKSEDRITAGSAEKFVSGIIKSGHEAVLEHYSLCYTVNRMLYGWFTRVRDMMETDAAAPEKCYLRFSEIQSLVVSGNIRAWRNFFKYCSSKLQQQNQPVLPMGVHTVILDNRALFPEFVSDAETMHFNFGRSAIHPCNPWNLSTAERLIHCDVTVRFIVDRGVSHELVRHRPASFCQESTRYCNYASGNFGDDIKFIEPFFFSNDADKHAAWMTACKTAESIYKRLIRSGSTPQEARSVLPNSLKTEVCMTANLAEWRLFLQLRALGSSGRPHPQMSEVTVPLLAEFQQLEPPIFCELKK